MIKLCGFLTISRETCITWSSFLKALQIIMSDANSSSFTFPKTSAFNPNSLIIVGISFPVLSIISRGQVEILIVCIALISLYFYKQDKLFLSANLIAIMGFIKVFPLLLAISFIKSYRNRA